MAAAAQDRNSRCRAILFNPRNSQDAALLQGAGQAARTLRTELLSVEARARDEIDAAFAAMAPSTPTP